MQDELDDILDKVVGQRPRKKPVSTPTPTGDDELDDIIDSVEGGQQAQPTPTPTPRPYIPPSEMQEFGRGSFDSGSSFKFSPSRTRGPAPPSQPEQIKVSPLAETRQRAEQRSPARVRQAASLAQSIEAAKNRGIELLKQSGELQQRDPNLLATEEGAPGQMSRPIFDSAGKPLRQHEILRARGEAELETANRLVADAQRGYSDLIEAGYGPDPVDPKRKWAYVKPRDEAARELLFTRKQGEASDIRTERGVRRLLRPPGKPSAGAERRQQERHELYPRAYAGDRGAESALEENLRLAASPEEAEIDELRRGYEGMPWPLRQIFKRGVMPILGEYQFQTPGASEDLAKLRAATGTTNETPTGLTQAAGAFMRPVVSGLAQIPRAAAEAWDVIQQTNPFLDTEERQMARIAPKIKPVTEGLEATARAMTPVNPADQGWMTSKIPQAFGSAASFAIGGAGARALKIPAIVSAGGLGAAGEIADMASEADKLGVKPEDRDLMVAMAAATGMTEMFGLGRALEKFGLKQALIHRAVDILEEGGQEALQTFLENVNAAYVGAYQPGRGLDENVLESALLGSIVGSGFQAVSAGAAALERRQVSAQAAQAVRTESVAPPAMIRPSTPVQTTVVPKAQLAQTQQAQQAPTAPLQAQPATVAPTAPLAPQPAQPVQPTQPVQRPQQQPVVNPPQPAAAPAQPAQPQQPLSERDKLIALLQPKQAQPAQEGVKVYGPDETPGTPPKGRALASFEDEAGNEIFVEHPSSVSRRAAIAIAKRQIAAQQQAQPVTPEEAPTADLTGPAAQQPAGTQKTKAEQNAEHRQQRAETGIRMAQQQREEADAARNAGDLTAAQKAHREELALLKDALSNLPKTEVGKRKQVRRGIVDVEDNLRQINEALKEQRKKKSAAQQPAPATPQAAPLAQPAGQVELPTAAGETPPRAVTGDGEPAIPAAQPARPRTERLPVPSASAENIEELKSRRARLVRLQATRGGEFPQDLNDEERELGAVIAKYENEQAKAEGQTEIGPPIGAPEDERPFGRPSSEDMRKTLEEAEAQLNEEAAGTRGVLPKEDTDLLDRSVSAVDALFADTDQDVDALDLLDRAVDGDKNAETELKYFADTQHGIDADTIDSIIDARRSARQRARGPQVETGAGEGGDQGRAAAPGQTGQPVETPQQARPHEQKDLALINFDPLKARDEDYDRYRDALHKLNNEEITGQVDLPKWAVRKLKERIKLMQAERRKRVAAGRLGPNNPALPAPKKPTKAELGQRLVEQMEGREAEPEAAEEQPETVTHPDPNIDGRPIIAHTDDGRVVVENPDNKGGVSVVKDRTGELEEKPEAKPSRPGILANLAGHFATLFNNGRSFSTIVEARKVAADYLGKEIKPGTPEAKQIDEAIELGVVLSAAGIVEDNRGNPQAVYDALLDLYNRQPGLNVRTSTSVMNQAYSTPVPIAYVASQLAGINENSTVYEPTAGNGALLIAASDSENVHANELNPDRAKNLRDQGFSVTENNAAEWTPRGKFDAVIANPPFGVVRDDRGQSTVYKPLPTQPDYRTTEVDHAIAFKALESMKDNGRAVLILGGLSKLARSREARAEGYNAKAKRRFYYYLYQNYNVVDHFTVAGELYEKQGAGWPVDVIVIDGRGKSARQLPAVDVPRVYENYSQLKEVLEQAPAQGGGVGVTAQPGGVSDLGGARPGTRPGYVPPPAGRPSGETGPTTRRPEAGGEGAAPGARPGQPSAPGQTQPPRTNLGQPPTANTPPVPGGAAKTGRSGEIRQPGGATGATGERPVEVAGPPDEADNAPGTGELNDFIDQRLDALLGEEEETQPEPEQNDLSDIIFEASHAELTAWSNSSDAVLRDAAIKELKRRKVDAEPEEAPAEQPEDQPLSTGELDDLIEQRLGAREQAEEPAPAKKSEKPSEPRPPRTKQEQQAEQKEPTAGELVTQAATKTAEGVTDALKGLMDLFGGAGQTKLNVFPTFDEDTWAKAKPLFEKAVSNFKGAARDVGKLIDHLIHRLETEFKMATETLRRMKPYLSRFIKEFTAKLRDEERRKNERKEEKLEDTATHKVYKPGSKVPSVNTLVPVNMATAVENALARLEKKVGSLDDYVAGKLDYNPEDIEGYFSAEQVDALALAIDNIERGRGFIIGDQTGIGKGRVVAGIIRYAIKKGKVPIFVTEKPALYADMIRDLTDIGMADINPIITNSDEAVPISKAAFEWAAEVQRAEETGRKPPPRPAEGFLKTAQNKTHAPLLESITANGLESSGYDVIFTTYNQMQKKKGVAVARHELLERLSRDGVVILDESHNAGGGPPKIKEGQIIDDRARFVRRIARKASAVFYSSATYAKRPEVMDLYFKTDLSQAVSDQVRLPIILKAGGVPLQQVTASMLTEAGQYIRREKSFDGVDYKPAIAPVRRESAEDVGRVMSGVVLFDQLKQPAVQNIRDTLAGSGQALASDQALKVESSNFTALMHNVIDQMLLNLKAGPAADAAIAALKRGEKPVVTVANTMGAFVEEYTEQNEIKSGEVLNLDFSGVLQRYLDRSRRISIKNPDDSITYYYMTDDDLGPVALAQYNDVKRMIRESDFSEMVISPLDVIHSRIRAAGYKTAEITGRGFQIDYSEGVPIYRTRPAAETSTLGRRQAINGFNDGSIDVLVINQSGATGISLHASKTFEDNRRRHMIIAQAEKNVDTHMQMLGRIHRTGQVGETDYEKHRAPEGKPKTFGMPRYTQLMADLPSEKRPAAVLMKKMASLNANTTAARGSAVTAKDEDVVDFMNEFGDEVAANLMREDQDLWHLLGEPEYEDAEGHTAEDAMRKVTGRIPLLDDIDEQERIYQRLTEEYKDYVALMDAMGKNILEAKTLDLQAETVESETLSPSRGADSPFTRASNVEKVRVKRLGKPMTSAQVIDLLRNALGQETGNLDQLERVGDQQIKGVVRDVSEQVNSHLETALNKLRKQMEGLRGELADTTDSQQQTRLERAISVLEGRIETAQVNARAGMILWRSLVQMLHTGAHVQLSTEEGILYGVVSSLERKGKSKNPVALSDWRVNVVVADAARSIQFPLSQVTTEATSTHRASMTASYANSVPVYNAESGGFDHIPMAQAFDEGQSESKETRYIVTGNILAGFEQAQGSGQIVNYTDKDKNVKQGILMPRNWNREQAMQNREVVFTSPDHVMRFLEAGGQLRTRDTHLRFIQGPHGGILASASAAKGKGGKYYENRRILSAINGKEFTGRRGSSVMTVTLTDEETRAVADMLISGEAMGQPTPLLAASMADRAREIVQGGPPAAQPSRTPETETDDEAMMVVQTMIGLNPAAATGAPVEFARMRARLPHVNKERFDAMMKRLSDVGRIALHRHDYPQSLSEAERNRLVKIGNDYFNAATIIPHPGHVMGLGFGSLQALFNKPKKPKTTPLRQIADVLGHGALKVDPVAIEKETRKALIEALSRGKAGSLPFARATYWAEKLGAKKVAAALGKRQQKFILKTLQVVQEVAAASQAMDAAQRGSAAWEKARDRMDRARIQLSNRLSKAVAYTTPAEYAGKAYKASLLSAPHIPGFNLLHQTAQFPFHEAQRAIDFLVPAKVFAKWGISYEKAPVDIRTWAPAMAREVGAIAKGAGSSFGDIKDMLYYGVTKTGLKGELAQGLKAGETGGTDKYELGHRPKLMPGLDQAIMAVGRLQGAADVPFYNVVFSTALAAEADATARQIARDYPQLKLTKADIKELARDLAHEPSPAMVVAATDEANRFKLDYSTLGYRMLQAVRNLPVEKMAGRHVDAVYKAAFDFVIPFSKIPLAAVDTAFFRYSPVGAARVASRMAVGRVKKAQGEEFTGRFKTPEAFGRDTAELYRQSLVGSVAWLAAYMLGSLAYVGFTGGADDEDRLNIRAVGEALGEKYAPEMTVGDTAYEVGRLGPVGQAVSVGAQLAAAKKRRYQEGRQDYESDLSRYNRAATAAGRALVLGTPLGRGAEDIVEAFDTKSAGKGVGKFLAGKAKAAVPGAMRDVAKMTTPTKTIPEDTSGMGRFRADLESGIPSARKRQQPRLDVMGREIAEPSPFSFTRPVRRDRQLEELRDLDVGLSKPQREQGESAVDFNKRMRERGGLYTKTLGRLGESETMQGAEPEARRAIYEKSLKAPQMERAEKLSPRSVERELGIEGLRGQAYAELRKLPEYQSLNEGERREVRKMINEELDRFRAKASSVDSRGRLRHEQVAKVPDWTPADLAKAALEAR